MAAVAALVVFLLVVLLLVVVVFAIRFGVAGTRERAGRGTVDRRRAGEGAAAAVARARGRRRRRFDEPAFHSRVVEVDQVVAIATDERLSGDEEDVAAVFAGVL